MADTAVATEAPAPATGGKKTARQSGGAAAGAKKPKAKPTHPKTSEMVNNAIKEMKERSGSSLQAIKKYIAAHYKVDAEKLAPFIRKYLKSAVESGALIQTKGKGASGSFKLESKSSSAKKPSVNAGAGRLAGGKKKSAAVASKAGAKKATSSAAGAKTKKAVTASASGSPSKSSKASSAPKDKKAAAAKKKPASKKAASSAIPAKAKATPKAKKTAKPPTKKPKAPKPKKAAATPTKSSKPASRKTAAAKK